MYICINVYMYKQIYIYIYTYTHIHTAILMIHVYMIGATHVAWSRDPNSTMPAILPWRMPRTSACCILSSLVACLLYFVLYVLFIACVCFVCMFACPGPRPVIRAPGVSEVRCFGNAGLLSDLRRQGRCNSGRDKHYRIIPYHIMLNYIMIYHIIS